MAAILAAPVEVEDGATSAPRGAAAGPRAAETPGPSAKRQSLDRDCEQLARSAAPSPSASASGSTRSCNLSSPEDIGGSIASFGSRSRSTTSPASSRSSRCAEGEVASVNQVLGKCCEMLELIAGRLQDQHLQLEEGRRRRRRSRSTATAAAPLSRSEGAPTAAAAAASGGWGRCATAAPESARRASRAEACSSGLLPPGMWTWEEARRDVVRADLARTLADAASLQRVPTSGAGSGSAEPALREARARLAAAIVEARSLGLAEEELQQAEGLRRRLHNMLREMRGQVRVFCRLRPMSARELERGESEAVRALGDSAVEVPSLGLRLAFDAVFAAPTGQAQVFEECRDLVRSVLGGQNATVMCYGQTGAGKTYTMYGTPGEEGLAARMARELFACAGAGVAVTGSLVELHNNRLVDLLATPAAPVAGVLRPAFDCRSAGSAAAACSPPAAAEGGTAKGATLQGLHLRRESEVEVSIEGLADVEVASATELEALIELGAARRATAAHALNADSSRSHVLLTLRLVRPPAVAGGPCESSKLVFCDLGGSERLKRTEAAGEQAREAIEINKSLAALGDVIEAVVQRRSHVPYRNHKLTQLLQDALGGSAKALLFINCSPASSSVGESVAALKFAARARGVVNSSSVGAPHRNLRTPK